MDTMTPSTIKSSLFRYFGKTEQDLKVRPNQLVPSLQLTQPQIQKYFKEKIVGHLQEFISYNDCSIYELQILQAHAIGKIKDVEQAIQEFKRFSPFAREWSVVDTLCGRFILARKYQAEVFEIVKNFANMNDEYYQRIAAVLILCHFLNDSYIKPAISILIKLKHPGYYTKMGVAWAIATVFVNYENLGLEVIENHQLERWTHHKAIQKAIESFRVRDEMKNTLRTLRFK